MKVWEYMKARDEIRSWYELPKKAKVKKENMRNYIRAMLMERSDTWRTDMYEERENMTDLVMEILHEIKKNTKS